MKKFTKFLIYLSIFLVLVMPTLSLALNNGGLVPCDNTTSDPCNFTALMALVNKIITFVLVDLVLPIAAVMFAYAGFLMVTAPGSETKTKAKNIFTNTVLGLVFAVAAWLIVSTLLAILGYDGTWIGLKVSL